ncbi:ArsC/Spx/MgsR family protein [Enterococcus casseliflavus]|uniref:ArsC/Spx/MgsR family protein n=1 Tax=Enterococcus casseliflavus TaxID=37734 RepID=UPI003BC8AD71
MKNLLYSVTSSKTCAATTKWLNNNNIPFDERRISKANPLTSKEIFYLLSISQNGFADIIKRNVKDVNFDGDEVPIEQLTTNELVFILAKDPSIFKAPILLNHKKMFTGFKVSEFEEFFLKQNKQK